MGLDPSELLAIASSYRRSQLIYALASLRIPDALAGGAATAAAVAEAVSAPAATVARLLRAAASEGVIDGDGSSYSLNPFSSQLRSGADPSQRDMVLGWSALRSGYLAFGHLDEAVRAGTSGIEVAFGERFHTYMRSHPAEAALYEAAMESTVDGFRAAAEAYDFSRHRRVVDVGGGQGSFLVAILRRHPDVEAVLFDLPDVVDGAPARLAAYPEGARISIVGGDMFADVPAGAGAYVFSTVLRCFTDEECVEVLRRCRERMAPGGVVLALEMVMPEGVPPSPRALADLQALVVYGGRDRTEQEWTEVMGRAGFAPPSFHPAGEPFSYVAAEPAG